MLERGNPTIGSACSTRLRAIARTPCLPSHLIIKTIEEKTHVPLFSHDFCHFRCLTAIFATAPPFPFHAFSARLSRRYFEDFYSISNQRSSRPRLLAQRQPASTVSTTIEHRVPDRLSKIMSREQYQVPSTGGGQSFGGDSGGGGRSFAPVSTVMYYTCGDCALRVLSRRVLRSDARCAVAVCSTRSGRRGEY